MNVTAKEACKYYNISYKTLDRWANAGKIKFTTNVSNHRRFIIEPIEQNVSKKDYLYARVSSRKQSNDLERQIEYLTNKFPNTEVISDVGSAFNFNRKGFVFILKELFKGNVSKVYVANSDRFARISFQFFEWIFEHFGAKLINLSSRKHHDTTYESEFTRDILAIITHYTAKYHGKRRYSIKPEQSTTKQTQSVSEN
jgi:predicted site-specific integrase-resolvase